METQRHTPWRQSLVQALLLAMVFQMCFPIPDVLSASSWSPTLLVNTEAFQVIDDSDTASNLALRFGATVNEEIRWDRVAGRFNITDDVYVQGALGVTGNLSGTTLRVDRNADIWGALGVSGATVLNRVRYVWPGTAAASSGKVLKVDPASGQLSWSADQTGGGSPGGSDKHVQFNDGGSTFGGDAEFVWDKTANSLGVRGSMSGYTLRVNGNADIWGVLSATGSVKSKADFSLNNDNDTNDAVLTFGNQTAAQTLKFINLSQRFELSKPLWINGQISGSGNLVVRTAAGAPTLKVDPTAARVGIGKVTPATALDVAGTVSGALMQGTAMNALQTFEGSGLSDCDTGATSKLLWDVTTKKFSCGTDQTGGGGGASITRIAGSSGAAGADITWQNLTSNSATCNTTALCAAIMTTTGVGAGTWKFKYTLIYQSAATTTGIGFGINHTGTVGEFQAMWSNATTGGAAATGIGDNDTTTSAGQLMEAKHDNGLNAVIGSASAGVATANADVLAVLEGIIVVTGSGNLELKIASEVASSNVLVKADSMLELLKIE